MLGGDNLTFRQGLSMVPGPRPIYGAERLCNPELEGPRLCRLLALEIQDAGVLSNYREASVAGRRGGGASLRMRLERWAGPRGPW